MERVITLEALQDRHARLLKTREEERQAFERKDIGYMFVLGELEQMIAELQAANEIESAGGGGE